MADSIILRSMGDIVEISMNRPERFNAFDLDMIGVFADRLTSVAVNDDVRAVIVSGEGNAFCAGGDLKWAESFDAGPSAAFHQLAGRFHQAIIEIRRMPKPVIAALEGVAAGAGFSLALACDFRVMAQSSLMRQGYTSQGLCIDGGGTFTLPRLVGLARALDIAAFDRPISAQQAQAWGLVNKVVPDRSALDEAINMARELTEKSLNSFGWSKRLLTDSLNTSFETQLELERNGLCHCAEHSEGQEGIKAFVEKRRPVFSDKK